MTNYICSDDSITDNLLIIGGPDIKVSILLRELRRERTGLHAMVAIAEGGKVLGHDTFNIGRSEDRRRLAKACHSIMTRTTQELLPPDGLTHHLDMVCLWAATQWENSLVAIVDVDANAPAPPRSMLLFPHVEAGTGTIVFGVPGAGKSWLMALMAISLATGMETIWGGARRTPCLYVDLERNEIAFQRRLYQIRLAMKVELPRIAYLRGRGLGLSSLRRRIRDWVALHPGAVVLYDSISRAVSGSLVDDDVANSLINMANGLSDTWVALAHSPRADAGHVFGSMHFDAGADMMIKMSSEHRGQKLGCSLTVTKANHTGAVPVFTFELEFDEGGLIRFGKANQSDWPELAASLPDLIAALLDGQDMSATHLAKETKTPLMTVTDNLKRDERFEIKGKLGKEVLWGMKRA